MTIKQIGLSAATASVLVTTAFAGTLSPTGVPTVSSELISVTSLDLNLTNSIDYTCSMTNTQVSSASQAGIELSIPGLKGAAGLKLIKADSNITIALQDNIVGEKIIFKGETGQSIVEGVAYKIVTVDSNSSITNADTNHYLNINTVKGSTNLVATLNTTSSDGVSVLDVSTGAILESKSQFSLAVTTKADALIDASTGFYQFTGSTTVDTIAFKFTSNKGIDHRAQNVTLTSVLTYDQNLTAYNFSRNNAVETIGGTGNALTITSNDLNNTYVSTAANVDDNISSTYVTTFTKGNGTANALDVTNFTLSGHVTFTGTTENYVLATDADAGAWKIFGYNVSIPNVIVSTNKTSYANFTNMSSIPASVIFTFLPQQADLDGEATSTAESGDTCIITSASQLPVNTSVKYNLNKLLENSTCTVKEGNYALKVSIPTNPAQVIGNAYVKNISADNFITLPLYADNNHLSY